MREILNSHTDDYLFSKTVIITKNNPIYLKTIYFIKIFLKYGKITINIRKDKTLISKDTRATVYYIRGEQMGDWKIIIG
jgi:hypothetical protein